MKYTALHQSRRIIHLNEGWKFTKEMKADMEYDAYHLTKTGAQVSPAAMSYDDHGWEEVTLPHDFEVIQELNPQARDYNGYLDAENCWYRKFFCLDARDKERRIILHFDGITGESKIWVNGCLMRKQMSSYCDVEIDITDVVRFGAAVNLIAVFLDHTWMQGWWYQGGGLYRKVWLEITDLLYLDSKEVQILTEKTGDAEPSEVTEKTGTAGSSESKEKWKVRVNFEVNARYGGTGNCTVRARIFSAEGILAAEREAYICQGIHPNNTRACLSMEMTVEAPALWDIHEGNCYLLDLELSREHEIRDSLCQRFGFREIHFDAEQGFFINGKRKEIRGFCFHEDEGNLGLAVDASVYERRIQHLVEMGANAYRCSHNAPARELLDLCDLYGIMVMEETRRFDTGELGREDLRHLVRRDRNHPSVILWSVGNEEPWQKEERGHRIAQTMKGWIRELDPSRLVTMAMHDGLTEADREGERTAADAVDVIGVNYNHRKLEEIHKRYPNKPIIGSEMLCLADTVVECGNPFSGSEGAYETLEFGESHPYYGGTFAWAGEDYRGEHRNLGFFTDACPLNINGDKKDGFYQYAARWREDPVLHICGHWNPTEEAMREVVVCSNMDKVLLYVNGRKQAEAVVDKRQHAVFKVPYEPGELKAVGIRGADRVTAKIRTSGEAYAFRVCPEKTEYPADGEALVTVRVEAIDTEGNLVPTASHIFETACNELAECVCTDNADPYCSCFPEKEVMCLYKGKGMAVFRCRTEAGVLKIRISGMLKEADCCVNLYLVREGEQEPARERKQESGRAEKQEPAWERSVSVGNPYINDWFMSHIYQEKPDIYAYTTDDNYIYWRKSLESASMLDRQMPFYFTRGGGYIIYCMEPDMPDLEAGKTGAVVFEEITGEAEILISMRDYMNRIQKRYYLEKHGVEGSRMRVELPGIVTGDRLIIKLVIKGNHWKCGITGPVRFEV